MEIKQLDAEDIATALDKFRESLEEIGLHFLDEERNQSVKFCLKHHKSHLRYLGVRQVRVDPYKVVTWFAFDLATGDYEKGEKERAKRIVDAAVATLCTFLNKEKPVGNPFDSETIKYVRNLAFNEIDSNTEHGIGKNGLFSAFHCSLKVKRFFRP